jgi:hypothetical protein
VQPVACFIASHRCTPGRVAETDEPKDELGEWLDQHGDKPVPLARKADDVIPLNDVARSVGDMSQATASAQSRPSGLGYLNCQTVRESNPKGIQEPLTARPAMLYVNGSPLAARQPDLTLIIYDRISQCNSGADNQTLILELCRVTRGRTRCSGTAAPQPLYQTQQTRQTVTRRNI